MVGSAAPPAPVLSVDAFVRAYEEALVTNTWAAVSPLVHVDACVTFSDGRALVGKAAVRAAFERNFAAIKDDTYAVSGVHWVSRAEDHAVYTFAFAWTGTVDGKRAGGQGRGTAVIVRHEGGWQLIAEHLGPAPKGSAAPHP
ncbi:MAG TPA: nuclear transport factor 2 family protein [Candidatus Thermoplasmatota archaeon]